MTVIGDILLGAAGSLLASFVEKRLQRSPEGFAAARVNAKIQEISCAIMEPLTEFLIREGASKSIVESIVGVVSDDVKERLLKSDRFVELGLDVDRITQDVLESMTDGMARELSAEHPEQFHMVTRAFIQLAVDVPPIFANWEKVKFQSQFKQIDELRNTFAQIYEKMETISAAVKIDQNLLERICAYKVSLSALKLTIHGLRQSAIPQADIDKLFVQPRIVKHSIDRDSEDPSWQSDYFLTGRAVRVYDTHETLLEEIKAGEKVLLTASAGAGKSTWSEWMGVRALAVSNPRFALVKHLRKMDDFRTAPSLLELIKKGTPGSFSEQIGSPEVAEWCLRGQVLLVLDGLDEVAENVRDDALSWIDGILAAYPGCIAIVTSRPLSTDHGSKMLRAGWSNFSIAPFDNERVSDYISKFQEHGPEVMTGAKKLPAGALAEEWMKDPTIGPLTRNPLLLSTLLVVHHMDGELPDDRAQLYNRYVDGMLGLWETRKELISPAIPLTKNQKVKILQAIAINMIAAEVDAVGQSDAQEWIGDLVAAFGHDGKTLEVLEHLRERSGLLIGPGQYTFAHKSVGEYLVARACLEGIYTDNHGTIYDENLIFHNCNKDRWNTVLFLWAGVAPTHTVQKFIDRLVDSGNLRVAGGLMYDRRKSLDSDWLREAFWKLAKLGAGSEGYFEEATNSHFVYPGYFEGLQNIVVSAHIHVLASLANEVDERKLLEGLVELEVIQAEDLKDKFSNCGWSFWLHFQSATDFTCPENISSLAVEDRRKGEFATAFEATRTTGTSSDRLKSFALDLLEDDVIFEACQIAVAQDICERFAEIIKGNEQSRRHLDLLEDDAIFQKLFREGHRHEAARSGEFDDDHPVFHDELPLSGVGHDLHSTFLRCADIAVESGLGYDNLVNVVRFVGNKY